MTRATDGGGWSGALGVFNRHPSLFVVALALVVVLSALNLLRQATPGDLSAATVQIRSDIAALSVDVGSLRADVATLKERQDATDVQVAVLAARYGERLRAGREGATVADDTGERWAGTTAAVPSQNRGNAPAARARDSLPTLTR